MKMQRKLTALMVNAYEDALERNGWNVTRTAEELGVDRKTVYNAMKRFDLKRPTGREGASK